MSAVDEAYCLRLKATEHSSEHVSTHSGYQRFVPGRLAQTSLHLRGMLPLSRRRAGVLGPALAACGATTCLTAKHVATRIETAATAMPLAPVPPPLPPSSHPAHPKHRLFGNPLHGLASWYGSMWNGRPTASGETFDESQMTAAHKSLPLGTLVRVTNLTSMRSVIVRINDRGAFAPNRVIDLSSAAARELGMMKAGLTRVSVEIVGRL